jgi:aryl-alcohol dehydrogenase-like predicted oxidoreductase
MLSKLALGTVQFGVNYGVSNVHGKTTKIEASKILQFAYKNGINVIDTATSYGNSESTFGKVVTNNDWRIITKTPSFSDGCINGEHVNLLKKTFDQSLINLRQQSVHGLLLHSCDDLLKPGGSLLFKEMERLKSIGKVKKIGASVYSEVQIKMLLDKYNIDLIQLPINIFDQYLLVDGWLEKLKNKNVEIHARSTFLQGLLLMPRTSIPTYFLPIKEKIELFSKSAQELSLSKLELALGYVMGINEIDKIVVGVNTIEQLREIIEAAQVKVNPMEFTDVSINNPIYTNPSLWKI